MVRRVRQSEEKLLTEVELELMTVLWRLGRGSVANVMEALPSDRKLAYTSVSTMLRILEQKEILEARKEGRGHIYIPRKKKAEYEARAIQHVVNHVFDGAPLALVKQLLETADLNQADLDELKKLLNQVGEKK